MKILVFFIEGSDRLRGYNLVVKLKRFERVTKLQTVLKYQLLAGALRSCDLKKWESYHSQVYEVGERQVSKCKTEYLTNFNKLFFIFIGDEIFIANVLKNLSVFPGTDPLKFIHT